MSGPAGSFTERDFYLAEFRGRSLGIAIPDGLPSDTDPLARVLDDLARNDTRVLLFADTAAALAPVVGDVVEPEDDSAWAGRLWRRLARKGRVGVILPRSSFAERCRDVVVRLRLAKLVWLNAEGALRDVDGKRISAVALPDLERRASALATSGQANVPFGPFRQMLERGVTSVSLVALGELEQELFTYAGSGTFFSRERYTDVRELTLDDFDAAAYLLAQGVAEGYLAPRSDAQIDALLSHGFGVFIEGRYLAGIGSLTPYPEEAVGEIAGLYTVTRFAGEGVGGHLIAHALDRAGQAGLSRIFACTTRERVEQFFLRCGFERIAARDVPPSKWAEYPDDRREQLRCVGRRID